MFLNFDEINLIECGRIGIIPYIKHNGQMYFLMGVDSRTGDVCDFGGKLNKGETNLQAAMREFMEETKQIIDPHKLKPVKCGIYDKRNNMCILFCEITVPTFFETAKQEFHNSPFKDCGDIQEMHDIIWLNTNEMIVNVYSNSSKFWNKVQYTLRNCADFNDDFLKML